MKANDRSWQPGADARFGPEDFTQLFKSLPTGLVLIGGQAVAIWAKRYKIDEGVTSKDIDFWGSTTKLKELAKTLKARAKTPHEYEMTWLAGAIETNAGGKRVVIELLQAVPGLDVKDPSTAAVAIPIDADGTTVTLLTPVALAVTKLHALRYFDQTDRNDLDHLKIAIQASRKFIAEASQEEMRFALWNCNRILTAYKEKKNQQLERKHGFRLLEAIPIETIRQLAQSPDLLGHERWANFLEKQWVITIRHALTEGVKHHDPDTINMAIDQGAKPTVNDFEQANQETTALLLSRTTPQTIDEAREIADVARRKAEVEAANWLAAKVVQIQTVQTRRIELVRHT